MHNYFTNYHTATCFDTIVLFLGELLIITLPSYASISNAAVGNTIYNWHISHKIYASSHCSLWNLKL